MNDETVNVLNLPGQQLKSAVLKITGLDYDIPFPVVIVTAGSDNDRYYYIAHTLDEIAVQAKKELGGLAQYGDVYLSDFINAGKELYDGSHDDGFVGSELFWATVAERGKDEPLFALLYMDYASNSFGSDYCLFAVEDLWSITKK